MFIEIARLMELIATFEYLVILGSDCYYSETSFSIEGVQIY